MERAALLERLSLPRAPIVWRELTVLEILEETAHAKTILLGGGDWPGHLAGQHVDVRLTAEDGYQAERSYSIASAPENPQLALTVERIDDGEVSPYLADELRPGDQLELRGPIGGHFTWRVEDGGPLLLVAGGSGLVPLMAMIRHRTARGATIDTRLLASSRSWEDLLYRDELMKLSADDRLNAQFTLTRMRPPGWTGFERRVDADMLTEIGPRVSERPRIFVCGPTAFVETAADALVAIGHPPASIHAERFGPT
jgi:ferredoxin-NADP reductase